MRCSRILASLAACGLLVAACSGDDTSSTTESPATEAPEPADTTTTSDAPATSDAATTTEAVATTEAPPLPGAEVPLFADPGPYAVGVVTLDLGDRQTEVWYPVDSYEVQGAPTEIFDTLSVFPESLQPLIPEELSGLFDTLAVRDAAPLVDEGPYPVVVYSHGFGGFRQVATSYTRHLASWGFVVLSTDHLERGIAAQATGTLGGGEPGQDVLDVRASLDALAASDLGPLADLERIAITGHSAGAGTALRSAVEVEAIDALVSISGGGDLDPAKPALVVIAELDEVVLPERSEALFEQLSPPKWLVNLERGGHNSFTDSCAGIRDLGGLQSLVALIGEDQVARAEDGCTDAFVDPRLAWRVLNHYSVAFFRTHLGVADETASLSSDVAAWLGTGALGEVSLVELRAAP